MFNSCTFTTNIYGTFKSHKNRKHHGYSYNNFKPGIYGTKHHLGLNAAEIEELASAVCISNPLTKAIGDRGPFCTAFKRKQYFKNKFQVVEPVEYVLDEERNHTYQYVPLLQSLQQLLSKDGITDDVVENYSAHSNETSQQEYKSFHDGEFFKQNHFLSAGEMRICVTLYIDDFEVCNPLGTSRKKHKLCAIYWILSNLSPGQHSSLSSIYLALLCKSSYIKEYGYGKCLNLFCVIWLSWRSMGCLSHKLEKILKAQYNVWQQTIWGPMALQALWRVFQENMFVDFVEDVLVTFKPSRFCLVTLVFDPKTDIKKMLNMQWRVESHVLE
ncbi:uncharacterized protein LOC117777260 isoform X2 [Hippoglossus hippoglossus]|uniref:uncharacterized protein LOC117777260 isoform X2 n=1 Tax=Hippoglossus hippoglossus TaxID=8267 RepID=UPI00148B623A|nr:uncharacterized protein LOC117777260 isoform X2 [Hippoglossus hippoglossus]